MRVDGVGGGSGGWRGGDSSGDASERAGDAELVRRAEERVQDEARGGRVDGYGEVVDERAPADDAVGVVAGRVGMPAAGELLEMWEVVGDSVAVRCEPGDDAGVGGDVAADAVVRIDPGAGEGIGAALEPAVHRGGLVEGRRSESHPWALGWNRGRRACLG